VEQLASPARVVVRPIVGQVADPNPAPRVQQVADPNLAPRVQRVAGPNLAPQAQRVANHNLAQRVANHNLAQRVVNHNLAQRVETVLHLGLAMQRRPLEHHKRHKTWLWCHSGNRNERIRSSTPPRATPPSQTNW
jgi:hypothetical protein